MRKLFSFNMVTLDGFFEGPNREIDWHNVDTEDGEFNTRTFRSGNVLLCYRTFA
jgi:hypothetical protein